MLGYWILGGTFVLCAVMFYIGTWYDMHRARREYWKAHEEYWELIAELRDTINPQRMLTDIGTIIKKKAS